MTYFRLLVELHCWTAKGNVTS